MVEDIMFRFSEQILATDNELISEITKFYFSLDLNDKEVIDSEIGHFTRIKQFQRFPREVFAFLLPLGNNLRALKKNNISHEQIANFAKNYFTDLHQTEFAKYLKLNL